MVQMNFYKLFSGFLIFTLTTIEKRLWFLLTQRLWFIKVVR